MRAHALVAAGVAALVIGVAGCGSSSSSAGRSPTGTTTSAHTTPAPTPATTTSAAAASPNAPEVNPAGDIPDNQAYVRYSPTGAGYSVKVPEGWARTTSGRAVTFTDKLNAIRLESRPASSTPSIASVTASNLPALARTVPGYRAGDVTVVTRSAGRAVRITYLADSPTDPVTGKSHTDAVERYVFFRKGHTATLTLSGPQGADNVDPWMIVTDSLVWAR